MSLELDEARLSFQKTGYLIMRQAAVKWTDWLDQICQEAAAGSLNVATYLEDGTAGSIRRVEDFMESASSTLGTQLDDEMRGLLRTIAGSDTILFKDKINFKRPGGTGYRAHLDGHFIWQSEAGHHYEGWRPYGTRFLNICIAIDPMVEENGPLELAESEALIDYDFASRMKNLEGNGPYLTRDFESKLIFSPIYLDPGDLVIFDWRVPHRSFENSSLSPRRAAFLTYSDLLEKEIRTRYYRDKQTSAGNIASKSLRSS